MGLSHDDMQHGSRVSAKPGLWTVDRTVDWTVDWTVNWTADWIVDYVLDERCASENWSDDTRGSHIDIACRSVCDRDQNGIKRSTFFLGADQGIKTSSERLKSSDQRTFSDT